MPTVDSKGRTSCCGETTYWQPRGRGREVEACWACKEPVERPW